MTRFALAIVVTIGLLASAARADQITLGGITLDNVRIINIADGKVYFQIRRDQRDRELASVTAIKFDAYPTLDKAIAKIDTDATAAVGELRGLAGSVKEAWLKPYVRVHLAMALDKAGQFDAALKAWQQAVAADDDAYFTSRVPRNLPTDRDERAKALATAKKLLAGASADRVKLALQPIVEALDQPLPEPEDANTDTTTNGNADTTPDPVDRGPAAPRPTTPDEPLRGQAKLQMRIINNLVESERWENAIEKINEALPQDDMPRAELYFQRGVCEAALGKPTPAAVSFLQVAVVYPGSEQAGEAFIRAGEQIKAAGRADVARKVWQAGADRVSDRTARARLQELIRNTPAE